MRRLAILLIAIALFFVQAQVLPALFRTNYLPDAILTAIVVITVFKGPRLGFTAAVIGGLVQDILISNFFGLHLFPYVIVVYLLSLVKHRVYEERWYWTALFVAICTLLVAFIRMVLIGGSGANLHFFWYLWYLVLPTVFWNALLGALGHVMLDKTSDREGYMW